MGQPNSSTAPLERKRPSDDVNADRQSKKPRIEKQGASGKDAAAESIATALEYLYALPLGHKLSEKHLHKLVSMFLSLKTPSWIV
jgi:hypothetical protein